MEYVAISKSTLSAVALESVKPLDGTYSDCWVVPVPEGYNVQLPTRLPDGTVILGTTWTLEQILAYVEKYETLLAKQEEAITSAIALVNGTAISDLTFTQLKILLLILCAERGWITVTNKINVTT